VRRLHAVRKRPVDLRLPRHEAAHACRSAGRRSNTTNSRVRPGSDTAPTRV
jgi:hypothetical protein